MEAVTNAHAAPSVRFPAGKVRLGWAVFAMTSIAWAVAVVLDLHTGNYGTLAYVCVAEAMALMGVLLTTRIPQHRISWVVAIAALWWGITGLANAYAVEALVEDPGSLPAGVAAAWFDGWAWLPGLALFLCALLVLMPDGRLASRRWWPAPASVAIGTVLGFPAASAVSRFDLAGTQIANPLASNSSAVAVAGLAGAVLVIAGLAASLAAFVVQYRRSEGDRRQQLRWVVVSFGLAVILGVAGALAWGVVPGAAALPALALLLPPAGIAVAVLKYRLYELDLVVNRALVYGALSACVVASYVLVVGLVGAALSDRGDLVLSLVVTGVVAVCFQPLRERVQRFVNQLMYGARDDPYVALARLGRRLETSLGADAVLPTVVETIGQTLKLQYVALALADNDRLAAVYGSPDAAPLEVPLVHQGIAVGELRVAPRPGEQLRVADHRLIADLAPQVAAAVHAAGLAQELRAAHRRLVELREEERRRIRRDLHDGLGPALAGLTFTLDAVHNLASSDLERASALLASATEQTQTMIGDVRRLIYGLRPPALDELGLVGSLRGLASREASPTTTITVAAPDALPPLSAAVEVAAYRIVQEALTNVARHALAKSCTVHLVLEPNAVLLEIADDGQGMEKHRSGVGLQTMHERATELGGSYKITSTPGVGTVVAARLPRLASEEELG